MRRSLAATLVALSLALTLAPAVVSAADEGKARATVTGRLAGSHRRDHRQRACHRRTGPGEGAVRRHQVR